MGRQLLFLLCALLALAGVASGQQGFSCIWYWYEDGVNPPELPFADSCLNGTPLPDGTPVYIYWDNDSNGPDDDDPLPPVSGNYWPSPPLVNRNLFFLNGEAMGLGLGWFAMDGISFASNGAFIPSRFYLRVCAGNIHWQSNVVTIPPGAHEIGPGLEIPLSFTCIADSCPSCFAPVAPPYVSASFDAQCDGVTISWSWLDDPLSRDEFRLSRDDEFLASIPESLGIPYFDTTAVPGVLHVYSVIDVRFCTDSSDSLFSPAASDTGRRMFYPPTPHDLHASNDQLHQVTVTWTYDTNDGLDFFVIRRNGATAGSLPAAPVPGQLSFVHLNPPPGPALYDVFGVNSSCVGTASLPDTGEALGTSADENLIPHPSSFILSSYPNPFNAVTSVRYELPRDEVVRLVVFDLTGKTLAILADGKQPAGVHEVRWDAQGFPSGVYIARLQAGTTSLAGKLLLLK